MTRKAALFFAIGLVAAATSARATTDQIRNRTITPPVTNIYQPAPVHIESGPNWGWSDEAGYSDAARRDHQMNRGF
jgi:hypothetical protein